MIGHYITRGTKRKFSPAGAGWNTSIAKSIMANSIYQGKGPPMDQKKEELILDRWRFHHAIAISDRGRADNHDWAQGIVEIPLEEELVLSAQCF